MKNCLLLIITFVCLPFVTTSSYLDIYSSRTERLLGNPTAYNRYMQGFKNYGINTTMNMQLTTADTQINSIMKSDIRIDKNSNMAGTIQLTTSGPQDLLPMPIDMHIDMVIISGTVYIKNSMKTLPTKGFELLDGKWIQMPSASPIPGIPLPTSTSDPLLLSKQLNSLISVTPIVKSTKKFTNNGYEIYLVDIDSSGIKKFVIDVINSITMQSGLPNQASLSLSSLDLDDYTSTLGVIGRKGEKIIMGMIIKKPNDPHRLLFLSHTTKTASHLTFRMVENEGNKVVIDFTMHNDISTLGVQDMQIKLIAKEQKIDLSAKIKTTIYDSGNTPITTPIGAKLLNDLIQ